MNYPGLEITQMAIINSQVDVQSKLHITTNSKQAKKKNVLNFTWEV